jgi:hypothetical protein
LLPAPGFRFTSLLDEAGLDVKEHRAGRVLALAALGLVVKQVYAAELRVVVAAALVVGADTVLVAQHLPKLCAHLVTSLARLNVHNLARRSSLESGSTREKKAGKIGETLETPCGSLARKTENSGGTLFWAKSTCTPRAK